MVDFAAQLDDHLEVIERSRALIPQMEEMARRIAECLRGGGTVLWMGNGGSAAEAQHISTELVGRFSRERAGLASIALNADAAAVTAIANDYGYDQVFARQVEALCRPGDVVVGLSTSGNSENVIKALRAAKERGATAIGMSGSDGGQLRAVSDLCLCVPSDDTQRVQETHLFIGHVVCGRVESDLCGDAPDA